MEIKSIDGRVLYVAKDAKDVRTAVEEAVRNRASLDRANLDGANLDGASLNEASLDEASLYGASLNGANLDGASLDGASLDGASLNRASLDGASLDGASLNGASLNRASLDGGVWAKVAETLGAAVEAMNDNGRHWIKGQLSQTLPDDSTAYCSIGSVEAKSDGTVRTLALWVLSSVAGGDIASFNDHEQTTWEDIKAVFAVAKRHAERLSS